ncbi:MinD/ParA family ATP-binding protein [Halobacterium noricense]|uniref:MinD/ParA family ATP-binding protein n=1 Tax=Halobacterium noricense TaxID=223182 RepID=UPI001E4983B3|nr:P-loop NTPase [Halobacterium noricense]UHH25117.1 AAA family ATPase [Halobacterium noricense]
MILAVCGGKGGVGKTTTALNLAAELDAVLVDADLGMADVPASHGPDLHDVLAGRADAVEAVRESRAISILPCGRTLAGAREGDPRQLVDALHAVADAYDDVVVDCPAGLRADVGLPLLVADACVLVTTPDRAALADALRARSLAVELDAGLAAVAYNRASSASEEVANALGAPVVAVPDDDSVAAAMDAGQPVAAIDEEAAAATGFGTLAERVRETT